MLFLGSLGVVLILAGLYDFLHRQSELLRLQRARPTKEQDVVASDFREATSALANEEFASPRNALGSQRQKVSFRTKSAGAQDLPTMTIQVLRERWLLFSWDCSPRWQRCCTPSYFWLHSADRLILQGSRSWFGSQPDQKIVGQGMG